MLECLDDGLYYILGFDSYCTFFDKFMIITNMIFFISIFKFFTINSTISSMIDNYHLFKILAGIYWRLCSLLKDFSKYLFYFERVHQPYALGLHLAYKLFYLLIRHFGAWFFIQLFYFILIIPNLYLSYLQFLNYLLFLNLFNYSFMFLNLFLWS